MSAARKNASEHNERVEQVRAIARDIFALAERMTVPARSVCEAEGWIHSGEELAKDLRAVFRGSRGR